MKRALVYSIFAYFVTLLICQSVIESVDTHGKWQAACIHIECEAQAASIREQLRMQIGAILQAAPEESEAGTYVFPMPFAPGKPNQSAE